MAHEVSLRTKVVFGFGEAAISIKNASLGQFLLFFYADVVKLAPGLVGAAMAISRLWDAVTDPVMGYLSDTTRSSWGRRRPFVIGAAVPLGIAYFLLFRPPRDVGSFGIFVYLLLSYVLLFTVFTVYAAPYFAWGAELTRDYHERTEVVQIRGLFAIVGGIIGAAAPIWIVGHFGDQRSGFAVMGGVLGACIAATGLLSGAVRERPTGVAVSAPSVRHFIRGLRQTAGNRAFALVFAVFCLMTVAGAIAQSVHLIAIKYWLDMYDFFPVLALAFAFSAALSFPLWLRLSQAVGKRRALLFALLISCVTPYGWLLMRPGFRFGMVLFFIVAGLTTGSLTLAVSNAVDMIDQDELLTGERREGAYFGLWALGLKSMNAMGTLIGGALLGWVGYHPDVVQAPETIFWLRMIIAPLPATVNFIAYVIFRRFPYDPADVAHIQAQLDARRLTANQSSLQPGAGAAEVGLEVG
jgi:GPH family glycoside/pentoside/hexuronide:cation symporter